MGHNGHLIEILFTETTNLARLEDADRTLAGVHPIPETLVSELHAAMKAARIRVRQARHSLAAFDGDDVRSL